MVTFTLCCLIILLLSFTFQSTNLWVCALTQVGDFPRYFWVLVNYSVHARTVTLSSFSYFASNTLFSSSNIASHLLMLRIIQYFECFTISINLDSNWSKTLGNFVGMPSTPSFFDFYDLRSAANKISKYNFV